MTRGEAATSKGGAVQRGIANDGEGAAAALFSLLNASRKTALQNQRQRAGRRAPGGVPQQNMPGTRKKKQRKPYHAGRHQYAA